MDSPFGIGGVLNESANTEFSRNRAGNPQDDHRELIIYTLSDSSGETAESVARAAVVQFPPGRASIYRLPQVKNLSQIETLVREVSCDKAVIAYTLVLPEYRETLEREARKYNIATIDLGKRRGNIAPGIERIANQYLQLGPRDRRAAIFMKDKGERR